MPGTAADHKAVDYMFEKFESFGMNQLKKDLVPIAMSFPNKSQLSISDDGLQHQIPCGFVNYAATTEADGIKGQIVYVGTGSEKEFVRRGHRSYVAP